MRTGLTLIASAVVGLAGCGRAPADDRYFPLEPGHRWTYRVTTQTDEGREQETLTLRTEGRDTLPALDGKTALRRRSDSGVDYWLQADASGIVRVASKSDAEPEPRLDAPPRTVLKTPYAVGTQWQTPTAPYLLMRRNDFPREIRHAHPSVAMVYQIEATDETVTTPAGRFEHCLRVRGTAGLKVYADPASGWREVPLVTTEWYCPDVGLVKLERDERVKTAFLSGGVRTLELVSWQ